MLRIPRKHLTKKTHLPFLVFRPNERVRQDRLPSSSATVVTGQGREDGDGDEETHSRKRARTAAWTAGLGTGTKTTERSTWPMMAGGTQDLLEIRQPKPVRGWERGFLHSSPSSTIYDKYRESSPSPRRGTPAPLFEIPDQADILEKPKERTPPRSLSSMRLSLKRPLTPNDQAPEAERATKRRCSTTASSGSSRDALVDHLPPAGPSHAMSGLSVRLRQDQCSSPPTPPWPALYLLDLPDKTSVPIPSYPPTPTSTTTSVRPTEARAKFLLQEIGRLVHYANEARKDLADSLTVLNAANERQKKIREELERVRRRRKVAERFYAAVRKGEQTVELFGGSLGRARHRGRDRRRRIEEDERGLV
ncbi:hypothetical protein BC629DRAFT_1553228 [Irpex lacteus]|nr:hypothetical protein BC629DRAFT_1553228 [Irpex lacteus]